MVFFDVQNQGTVYTEPRIIRKMYHEDLIQNIAKSYFGIFGFFLKEVDWSFRLPKLSIHSGLLKIVSKRKQILLPSSNQFQPKMKHTNSIYSLLIAFNF